MLCLMLILAFVAAIVLLAVSQAATATAVTIHRDRVLTVARSKTRRSYLNVIRCRLKIYESHISFPIFFPVVYT